MQIRKDIISEVPAKTLDGQFDNVWSGRSPRLFWDAKTTTGSMSLVCMVGKKVLDTFGRQIASKQQSWNSTNQPVMANIQL